MMENVDWIHMAQDGDQGRDLVNSVIKLQDPLNAGILSTRWATISFSRKTLLHGFRCIVTSAKSVE
jgi:hypothetical protein